MDPSFIVILALAFGAMWLMTNRTRKQQRQAGDFRANLEIGQEVMTGSGLYGTIVALDGDTITLESTPGNETRWIRAAISKLVDPPVVDDEEYTADDAADGEYESDEATDEYVDDDAADEYVDEADDDEAEVDLDEDDTAGDEVAEGDLIEVPDDLSTLPEPRQDGDPDKK